MSKRFKLPEKPTEEEMIQSSLRWWARLDGVRFEDWNEIIKAHAIPFEITPIPQELVHRTLEQSWNGGSFDDLVKGYEDLLASDTGSMAPFFAKLNTRSPKDAHETCVFKNIKDFVGVLAGSMRCFDDLCMLIHIDKAAVVTRPVFEIPKQNEWRVFVKDGKFQGMSQYFYDQKFDYTDSELLVTRLNVQEFVERIAIPNVSVESFVIDVFLQHFHSPPIIIETNPYGLSDPCVFESYDNIKGLAIVK